MAADLSQVRKYRKSAALAQHELAALVGLGSQHSFSDVELGAKRPSLDVAIGCALALDVPLHELFPHLAMPIADDLLARARALHERLAADPERADAAAYLAALINRLGHHALV